MKSIAVTLIEDEEGNLILPIPEELGLDWEVGDTIVWKDNGDGSFTLEKQVVETEYVLVEAISQYRMRYVVEVPKGKALWALDTVSLDEAQEFSQHHLGEVITSHRVITKEEALVLSDHDNDYAKSWTQKQKLDTFITPWKKD